MNWRRWADLLMVGLLAVLHGMAPLLHAHTGGESQPARGVHLHLSLAVPDASTASAHDLTPADSPAIGVGSEIKRDPGWQDDAAGVEEKRSFRPAQQAGDAPRAAGSATPRAMPASLRPPSHGPPLPAA